MIDARSKAVIYCKARPVRRQLRINAQGVPLTPYAQQPLQPQPIQPRRRPRVPRPPAPPCVRRRPVNICRHHIRFHFICVNLRRAFAMIDRIQHPKETFRRVRFAQRSKCPRRPRRPMRVLTTIFTDARHIALDIARVAPRLVKRRREKQRQLLVWPHQVLKYGLHCLPPAYRVACPRKHRPRLRNRIDATFPVPRRPKRRAVVIECTQIPASIPGVLLQRQRQLRSPLPIRRRLLPIAAPHADACKARQRTVQKPAQPDTLPASFPAHAVHPVIPVAAAHQRQAVRTARCPTLNRTSAMLKEAGRCPRTRIFPIAILLPVRQWWSRQERNLFFKNGHVPRRFNIVRSHIGQPQQIVRTARAHAAAGRWMPPVQHIPRLKLPPRRLQNLAAHQLRPRVHHRHHVLKLVAKTIRAAGLINR